MNRKIKFTTAILSASILITPIAEITNQNSNVAKANNHNIQNIYQGNHVVNQYEVTYNFTKSNKEVDVASEKLMKFFKKTDKGGIELNTNKYELSKVLNISLNDAQKMIDATKELSKKYENKSIFYQPRGFFGITVNLGPKVRSMGSFAAAAYSTGYVAWHLKTFAKTPHTAGVVGAISSAAGSAVGWAVYKGTAYNIPIGVNIRSSRNYNFYINIP